MESMCVGMSSEATEQAGTPPVGLGSRHETV